MPVDLLVFQVVLHFSDIPGAGDSDVFSTF
jgi:hypothetical protein